MKKFRSSFMALGRLLIALLFLWDAAMLIGAPKDLIAYVGSGLPFPEAAYAGAIAVQLIGGIGVLLGFKNSLGRRPAGAVLHRHSPVLPHELG